MILIKELITNLEIKSVKDLYKLKPLMEVTSLKINKSKTVQELNVARRTFSKYIEEFQKSKTRERENILSDFLELIKELLNPENTQIFYYKKNLQQYFMDNP